MSLSIYFLDNNGEDVEYQELLGITHNLNKIVDECGKLVGKEYYELVWKTDELLGVDNGKVPVSDVLHRLPTLIADLIKHENDLVQYLPSNGWGTFEGLIDFLCRYLSECYKHKDAYIYCCRWFNKREYDLWVVISFHICFNDMNNQTQMRGAIWKY